MPDMPPPAPALPPVWPIDPQLQADFAAAAAAEHVPAAELLRDFMRDYVRQQQRRAFLAEARRQSLAAAAESRDPATESYALLQDDVALFDEDHFASDWRP